MAAENISESVFVGLCLKIGTSKQVASRRDMMDISEKLEHNVLLYNQPKQMISGSMRDGFRLDGTDIDIMFWPGNHRVIWDFSQFQFYNTQEVVLILCDNFESPPGFTLLWVPLERADIKVISTCFRMNGMHYISSSKYREMACSLSIDGSTIHGPCASGLSYGLLEYDHAHCFVSDFWPPAASSWIDRCKSWLPSHVVNDIVRNGCHVVAIGHKLGIHAENEWRISFSRAEYKLVSSMNHTQFLTYGLLKLFLREIINNGLRDEDKLLCSYHMKTAVFWAIQQNSLASWRPQNLLAGFWVCFKLLLKWVYEGVCPNFFIPENNMFLSNIYGATQKKLFTQLYRLYEKDITLLTNIPSIMSFVSNVLCNPTLTICSDEHTLISEVEFELKFLIEISTIHSKIVPRVPDLQNCEKYLYAIEQLIRLPLTPYQIVLLQKFTASILQCTAFILNNMYTNTRSNKRLYIADKISCHLLKLAAKFGFVSDMLYIAMYYFKTSRYREGLSVLDITKVKLTRPYLLYMNERLVDRERYTEAVGGQSLSMKMRVAVASINILHNGIVYVKELIPEQKSDKQCRSSGLFIPPFVLLNMLEFLSSRHVDTTRAQRALDDLLVLVNHDRRGLIPVIFRDISWEILGICQQISGYLHAAFNSYQQSLMQGPESKIQIATRERIRNVHFPHCCFYTPQ